MHELTIANTSIHQDAEGRFSLNDLHKAAGGIAAQQPSNFLRNEQTQKLIDEINHSSDSMSETAGITAVKTINGGRHPGTHACKELIYAYAMWISPSFHLQVIRAYDALATGDAAEAQRIAKVGAGRTAIHPPKLFPDYFKVARLIGCDRNAAAISANQAVLQKTGENVLALLGQTHMEAENQELVFNVSDLADGISGVKMNKMLEAAGMQTSSDGRWTPTEHGMKFCRIFDTGKKHGNGAPIQQVKWSKDVLAQLSIAEPAQ